MRNIALPDQQARPKISAEPQPQKNQKGKSCKQQICLKKQLRLLLFFDLRKQGQQTTNEAIHPEKRSSVADVQQHFIAADHLRIQTAFGQ